MNLKAKAYRRDRETVDYEIRIERLEHRLDRLESKLNLLINHLWQWVLEDIGQPTREDVLGLDGPIADMDFGD